MWCFIGWITCKVFLIVVGGSTNDLNTFLKEIFIVTRSNLAENFNQHQLRNFTTKIGCHNFTLLYMYTHFCFGHSSTHLPIKYILKRANLFTVIINCNKLLATCKRTFWIYTKKTTTFMAMAIETIQIATECIVAQC